MSDGRRIRPVEKGDVEQIKEIAEATQLFPGYMLDDMIAPYFSRSKPDIWFICESDGTPVGFGFCEPERMTDGTWNLLAIGVSPSYQSRGAGADMMAYLENRLREKGERVLIVETMGLLEFERTRAFYRNNGYEEEARIREFYEAGADKVVFWKRLSGR
jgi:ribosomal protein S18 acetylase RimI-like enzyme